MVAEFFFYQKAFSFKFAGCKYGVFKNKLRLVLQSDRSKND